MGIKIRKDFNAIIALHQRVIQALKAQKVRQDQMLEKYGDVVQKELEIPSNKFMEWSKVVRPYLDSVISSKLMDFELISQYEKFIKEIVGYEANFVLTEGEIDELEYGFDMAVENSLKLEKKFIDHRKAMGNEIVRARLRAIELYQGLPDEERDKEGVCAFCGVVLDAADGDGVNECYGCQHLPENVKPFRSKVLSKNVEEESDENDGISFVSAEEIKQEEKPIASSETLAPQEEESKINDSEVETEETLSETEKKDKVPGETAKDRKLKKDFNKLMSGFKEKYQDRVQPDEDDSE
jgi:hypothetical protein